MKECEVMEVFSKAFHLMFDNISSFISLADAMRPKSMILYYEGEAPKYESRPNPYEEYFESGMVKKKVFEGNRFTDG